MPAKSWFSFRAVSEKETEICIYDAIGLWGVSAKSFIDELKRNSGKDIILRINSPGGVVTEGCAIFNALRRHKGKVTVQIDALAASMATYVALAGAPVRMAENAFFMIHNVSGVAVGTAEEIRRYADVAEKMQKNIVACYIAKTGKNEEEIQEAMDDETWFTAAEALEWGFVDEVTDPIEVAACAVELFNFRNVPTSLAGSVDTPATGKTSTPLMKLSKEQITELENQHANWEALQAAIAAGPKATALEGEKTNLTVEITDLKGKLTIADGKVTALEGEKTALQGKLTAAEGEVTTLKGEAKSATDRATEIAAAHRSAPAAKDGKSTQEGGADGKALYDSYQKAMDEGRSGDATALWNKHQKDLEAYVDSLDRKG